MIDWHVKDHGRDITSAHDPALPVIYGSLARSSSLLELLLVGYCRHC
jgi:hypothetical protein